MAGHNRYLRGEMNTVLVDVHGHTVVEAGDLMVLNNSTSMHTDGWSADNYAFPFDDIGSTSNNEQTLGKMKNAFLGVAMEGSESGVTEKITVATTGMFRYPLYFANSSTTIGSKVSAVTVSTGSGSGSSPQTVNLNTTTTGSTFYLGYITKTESSGASYVDFEIHTKWGLGLAS